MNPDFPAPGGQLSPEDLVFLGDVLDHGEQSEAIGKLLDDDEAFLSILDLADVRRAVMEAPCLLGVSPGLYFLVVVRRVFAQAGIDSARLTRYVAAVLAARVKPPRTPDGDDGLPDHAADYLERVAAAARVTGSGGSESFAWWKAAGDHFLVLTGLFPAYLDSRHHRRGAPPLGFYENFGAHSYRTAADHPQARRRGLSPTLHALSDAFGPARRALNQAAEEYLFLAN